MVVVCRCVVLVLVRRTDNVALFLMPIPALSMQVYTPSSCSLTDFMRRSYCATLLYNNDNLFIYLFIIKIVHVVQQSKRAIKLIHMQRDLTNSKLTIN